MNAFSMIQCAKCCFIGLIGFLLLITAWSFCLAFYAAFNNSGDHDWDDVVASSGDGENAGGGPGGPGGEGGHIESGLVDGLDGPALALSWNQRQFVAHHRRGGSGKRIKTVLYGESEDAPMSVGGLVNSNGFNYYKWIEMAKAIPKLAGPRSSRWSSSLLPRQRKSDSFWTVVKQYRERCAKPSSTTVRQNIFHELAFHIAETSLCDSSDVSLLILIHSKADHFEHRTVIRETYGSLRNIRDGKQIRLLFVLGRPTDSQTQAVVQSESTLFRDLIQGNFVESHRNLTLNFNLGLWWVGQYCPQLHYLAKLDDDTFLDVGHLVQFLVHLPTTGLTYCQVTKNRSPIRSVKSRWYVSRTTYPPNRFPDFCLGFGFVLSADLLPKLLGCSLSTKIIPLDDVYYTGLVARKAKLPRSISLWQGHAQAWLTPQHAGQNNMADYIFLSSKNGVILRGLWKRLWKTSLLTLLNDAVHT